MQRTTISFTELEALLAGGWHLIWFGIEGLDGQATNRETARVTLKVNLIQPDQPDNPVVSGYAVQLEQGNEEQDCVRIQVLAERAAEQWESTLQDNHWSGVYGKFAAAFWTPR